MVRKRTHEVRCWVTRMLASSEEVWEPMAIILECKILSKNEHRACTIAVIFPHDQARTMVCGVGVDHTQ
jgi:hypothetical protein